MIKTTKKTTKERKIQPPSNALVEPNNEAFLYVQKRGNHSRKYIRPVRKFSPKLIGEFNRAFIVGATVLNESGLSWTKVAQVCGMGISEIKRIRGGERNATLPALIHLCDGIGLSLLELFEMGSQSKI